MGSKGTGAKGKKMHKGRLHIRCRRCGSPSYHKIDRICSKCGYGRTKRLRQYRWMKKKRG
ncbi:MAG: 50S ribosomal protein L37e, partial [Nanoarchaeota archaeon]